MRAMGQNVNKAVCLLGLWLVWNSTWGQVRKTELSLGAGYEHNFFNSPSLFYQADSLFSAQESGWFLSLDGEWDLRLEGGAFVTRNLHRHQVDLYTTIRTRQFHPLSDASSLYGDLQLDYRYRLSKKISLMLTGGLTQLLTPEALKTPYRNIIAYAFRRGETGGGWELKSGKNHLSRILVSFHHKDYSYRNSLDRVEYRVQGYFRQRFRNSLGRESFLRLETYFMGRTYSLTRGGGVDEEGFDIVRGKRKLTQFQVDLNYERELNDALSIKPGFLYRYRDDLFPNRFGYQQLGPYLTLQLDKRFVKSTFYTRFLLRSYHNFPVAEGPSTFLRKNYIRARWRGELDIFPSQRISPFWDIGWESRTTNNEEPDRIAFRGYRNWHTLIGLKIKWK